MKKKKKCAPVAASPEAEERGTQSKLSQVFDGSLFP